MKTKPETEFIFVRPKIEDPSRRAFSIWRNTEDLDMTGYVYLNMMDNGMEEWVHEDDYSYHYKELHKYDNVKSWNGSEDHKEFVEQWNGNVE